jgi:outer membrane protein TolC
MTIICSFRRFCSPVWLFIAFATIPISTVAAPEGGPVLKLEDAVRIALQGNRQIQIGELDKVKAGEGTAEIRASRLPQLQTYALSGVALNPIHFTIPAGTLGQYPVIGGLPAVDSDITTPRTVTGVVYARATQPLTQLYKIGLAARESEVGEQAAQERVRQLRIETANQVRTAYYQIEQIQSQLRSAQQNLEFLKQLSDQTDRYLSEETVLKSDSLSVKARLAQQQYQILTLRDALETQKESLNRLMGRELTTPFAVESQPEPSSEEFDLEVARKRALEQRPELKQASLQSARAELEIKRQRAEYLPDVSAQLTYLSFTNIHFVPRNVAIAGVLFEWQPFDWGRKRHRLNQLKQLAGEAALTRDDVEQQVLLEVAARFRKLSEARALVQTQKYSEDAEREKLRVVSNRFAQNAALLPDVLQQQSAVAQADGQYQQAIAAFWIARAEFTRALGEE